MTTSVLVIDDNEELAENISEILDDFGVDVHVALNAEQAMARFDEREWSLVVTDVRMPGMNGLDLLSTIKAKSPCTPVMVMTGYADRETVARAHDSGALAVVNKPLDLDAFIELVEHVAVADKPVLIVEDDVSLVGNLTEILIGQDGVLVHPTTNVTLARRLAEAVDFSVALIDLRLPDGDGLALARELRQRQDGSARPVIIMTGYPEHLASANDPADQASGEFVVMTKPFAVPNLLERLREIV